MTLDLGGPGVGCSAMRVRRLLADELPGPERERMVAHLADCPRCQRTVHELHEEGAALRRDVPFSEFAAGVAEKLAKQQKRRPRFAQWAGFAAAAAVLLVAGSAVLRQPDGGGRETRSKGGAPAQLFVLDSRGTRALSPGEAVAEGAKLRLVMHAGTRRHAAVVLVEAGEASVLYDGPAIDGPLPGAFEWTGPARQAQLLVVVSDSALDARKLRGPADAPSGADVTEIALRR